MANSLDKLEENLTELMEKDDKYWRENDAKFRAARQMATYEQFQEIVKASHLRPLEKQDQFSHGVGAARGGSILNPHVSGDLKNQSGRQKIKRLANLNKPL